MEEKKSTNYKTIIKAASSLIIMLFLIMSFIVSAYRIPTGSMERTLRVGDMLLVNKFIYGFRTPDWIGIPFTEIGFSVPWVKTPFFKDIKQGDVTVFKHYDLGMDQWVYYVKRCIALAGQTVEIKDKEVYVDGKLFKDFYETVEVDPMFEEGKASARFTDSFRSYPLQNEKYKTDLISDLKQIGLYNTVDSTLYLDPVKLNETYGNRNGTFKYFYYLESKYSLCIPNARALGNESNDAFQVKFSGVTDDNILSKLNYKDNFRKFTVPEGCYFMMGDNRDNSLDSRYWGFVEEDYIVGKPIMVYFSWDSESPLLKAIRWSRIGYFIQ
ncbi:MAG: signal peptidase I [Candidatus Delongbacteria bacterium]|jgi:signal peptidase I|nr:signal peptidase I [Candidatus Delongbacteria bacterium]